MVKDFVMLARAAADHARAGVGFQSADLSKAQSETERRYSEPVHPVVESDVGVDITLWLDGVLAHRFESSLHRLELLL